ncbi:6828_t:CDS:2, partial [Scutellospora calospora]
ELEQLGERKVLSVANAMLRGKFIYAEHAFRKLFVEDEISDICSGLVDKKEVIVVTVDLQRGSSLPFTLQLKFKGYPVLIDYGTVPPFHRDYYEKLKLGINSVGKKATPVCQPGRIDKKKRPINCLNISVSGNSGKLIRVEKVSRSTFHTEGEMEDEWVRFKSSAFNPPKHVFALKVHGIEDENPFAGAPGDSDSPVFDKDKRLVGILHGGPVNKSHAYVVPIDLIIEHVKKKNKSKVELEPISREMLRNIRRKIWSSVFSWAANFRTALHLPLDLQPVLNVAAKNI